MGHRPKCLLELDGVPLIRRQLMALSQAGIEDVVVVLGHFARDIENAIGQSTVTCIHNPDPNAGQTSSLHVGLKALSPKPGAVLVALADQPLITTQDILDLVNAYKQRPLDTQVVQPTVDDLPGNPVIFSTDVRQQILAADIQFGCRQWQKAHPEKVHHWVSTNKHYRIDVDTLADIEALAVRTGRQLLWPNGQH
jgi:molybdenum cofactor cytidylyltransferase